MQRPPPLPVSRRFIDCLCLGAGTELSKSLLDLEASLYVLLATGSAVYANTFNPQGIFHRVELLEQTYLLPELHDLEALKVVQASPLLDGCALLCPRALVELLLDLGLLPLLRNVADTGGARQLGDDNRGEGEFGERNFLAGNGGLLGGTINKHLFL